MKKIMHGLFGDSSEDKKHHEQVSHHPEDLTGVHLNNQPIQAYSNVQKGSELAGVPLTIKIPMGYNVNPEHIHVTMEDRVLIVKYKNALDTQSGHMEEQLIKKIPMPEHVDAKKLRVMFKPEGYLLIEGPELQGSHYQQQHLASAAGESVKRDYADAVSHGVKKIRDDQPTVTPRLSEAPHGQTKSFEQETTYASKVVPPRVSEVGSQLGKTAAPGLRTGPLAEEHKQWLREHPHHDQNITGSHMEPRGPYIQEQNRPMAYQQQHQTHLQQTGQHIQHQNQTHFQQTGQPLLQQTGQPMFQQAGQPMIQQTQTIHGRFEGPLDTSGFASIQPSGYHIPGYLPENQMRYDVNRGVEHVRDRTEDIQHQAGHKWEETKDKAAELKDRAGDKLEEAKDTVADKWEDTKDKASELKDKAGDKLHDAKESVKETWEDTKDKAAELTDKAGDKLHDAKEGIKHGWENTKEKTAELADKVGDKLHDAKEGIKHGWENTKEKASELASNVGDKLEAAKDTVVEKTKAAKDKVADALTPDEKPEHHEIRREEFQRPIQQPVVQKEHVRIEKDYEYTKPAAGQPQTKPHGRVETHVQRREEQKPLNQNLHQQQVQQSIHHGHVNQPQAPQLPRVHLQEQQINRQQPLVHQQPQQHGRFEQHKVTEQHHRVPEHQPLKQHANLDRQAFQTQQPVGRRRSDETHLTESHHTEHQSQHTERQSHHTERQFHHTERQQDTQVPLVDTAVGRRMSQEDAKKGIEQRDWVNKPELRADHINKVGFDDIMKQSVAPSESGTGKSQVHFTPPAEGGRRGTPEGVDRSQQLHRDVFRPHPEGHERHVQHTQIRQEQHPAVQRHEVQKDVHEKHEDQPNKLERGLEKVADKVLGFFGVEVEGHHKPSEKLEEVKDQAKQKETEIKHRASEKVDQAKNKAGEMKNRAGEKIDQAGNKTQEIKHRAGEKIDQAGNKAQELKHRAGEKIDQAGNKAQELKHRAGNKVEDTKEHAGEAWERTKAKTVEAKNEAGQKMNDVKHTAGEKVDQAKNKASELKEKAGDKLEDAKESVKETWENTKEKASELADKAGEKLEAAKDTVVEKAKAAKDKIADTFTPSDKPEHHVQRTELHRQQPFNTQRTTEVNRQQQQLPAHGQRTRIEQDYEYTKPLGTNQQNLNRQNVNIPNPQMQPMVSEFQHRQPLQQPGVTHFEKHVEQHREMPGPTGTVEEHFEHHEVLPGQQPLHQRTGFQRQQHVQRPGETVGHKLDQTVEHGKERGEQMAHKAGEKLHEAKEKVGQTMEDTKEKAAETWEHTKDKAAELKDKAGDKLHDAKEAVVDKWEDTKDKAAELKDKAGDKLHDAKESVKETWEDTKDKAAELTHKAGDKLHDAGEGIKHGWENTKEAVGDKLHDAKETLVDAKDTVAEKLSHAKDKVVDFFTPEPTPEYVEHRKVSSPGARPASHLTAQTALEQRRREELHGKPVSVRLEGPVTISGRVVGGEVLASDLTSLRSSNVSHVSEFSGTRGARSEHVSSNISGTGGTHGARSEHFKSEVKTGAKQQQQQTVTTTSKVTREETKTVAPGGLVKKGTTTHQSPQAL